MAPTLKLTYFDGRGRAEICRLILAVAKKPYEDVRIQRDDWPKIKPTTPFGSVPILEVNGKVYAQGIALSSYLARENGLYGTNNLDDLMIDQIQQLREDLLIEESKLFFESDPAKKAELIKRMVEDVYPKIFGFFCKVIKENPAKSGLAVGKQLSLADIVMYEGSQGVSENMPHLLDVHPELKALRAKVETNDGIKAHLAKRKKTPF